MFPCRRPQAHSADDIAFAAARYPLPTFAAVRAVVAQGRTLRGQEVDRLIREEHGERYRRWPDSRRRMAEDVILSGASAE